MENDFFFKDAALQRLIELSRSRERIAVII